MAIICTINELQQLYSSSPLFLKGLHFLQQLTEQHFELCSGSESYKIPIDGDRVFALLQRYESKPIAQAKPEAHRKHIDLQYAFKGKEWVLWNNIEACQSISEYNAEKEVQWFSMTDYSQLLLHAPLVAVFYPTDVHAPCLQYQKTEQILKCVIKVAI